jgi:hypothetical protein
MDQWWHGGARHEAVGKMFEFLKRCRDATTGTLVGDTPWRHPPRMNSQFAIESNPYPRISRLASLCTSLLA